MDIHQIEFQILQLLALLIGSLVIWLLKQAISWLGMKLNSDRLLALESAVNKVMSYGVTQLDAVIREKGWDHVDSKNAVLGFALPLLEDRFETTLTKAGFDLQNPKDAARLENMMERMWPDVAARMSASPVTPPAPVVPAVVVPPAA